jgi:cytoskeletal protein CcmA (bactofilin family)
MEADTPPSPMPPRDVKRAAAIGKSIVIKGEVTGSEDMTIDGHVEGRIDLRGHTLLIGPNATIQAHVSARVITIMGAVSGNVTASEKIDLRASGSVEGDIAAPRVAIADGALFNGSIDSISSKHRQLEPLAIAV